MIKTIEKARDIIRKYQQEQIKDFRKRGWDDIADKMEKELETKKVATLDE